MVAVTDYECAVRDWQRNLTELELTELMADYNRGDRSFEACDAYEEWLRRQDARKGHDELVMDEWRRSLTDDECRRYRNRWNRGEHNRWTRAGYCEYEKRRNRRRTSKEVA